MNIYDREPVSVSHQTTYDKILQSEPDSGIIYIFRCWSTCSIIGSFPTTHGKPFHGVTRGSQETWILWKAILYISRVPEYWPQCKKDTPGTYKWRQLCLYSSAQRLHFAAFYQYIFHGKQPLRMVVVYWFRYAKCVTAIWLLVQLVLDQFPLNCHLYCPEHATCCSQ